MFITVQNLKTYYEISGKGKVIVLLHGWGGNHDSFYPIFQELKNDYEVVSLDFPGFGESELANSVWGINEYTEHLRSFLENMKIEKVNLVGHSFGGTIAASFSILYPELVENLVLVSAKLLKPKRELKKVLYQIGAKTGKLATTFLNKETQNILRKKLYDYIGEYDYFEAEGILQKNFVQVINTDLKEDLKKIKSRTLIVWGEKDDVTPISDARIIKQEIRNSELIIFPNSAHFSYLDEVEKFCALIRKQITKDDK